MKIKQMVLFAAAMLALILIGVAVTPTAQAQAVYGSILGTVTDPQGAAVANAKVTVTNQRKGTFDTTTTNSDGNYSVTHLVPDVYTIRAENAGFKASEIKDISVSADAGARVDLAFQVGGTSETVEVTAEAPQLKTDRADVATSFNEKYVEDIPILNRNFTTLQLMAPGSQKLTGWAHAATENPQGSQQIFTQGQHFSGTAFELDGTDNQDPILGIIVVNPNLDAVTEAKVALQNYDAEFGKAVSSVVTAQTKSGSNELHGSGFLFRRSDAQLARNPFNQGPNQADPVTHRLLPQSRWVQFGGTVGGAIIKNKLFFFGDYQGTRQTNGVSGLFNLPDSTARSTCTGPSAPGPVNCDLGDYLTSAVPGGGQIFDPATGNLQTGAGRTAFVGNLIPNSRLSPAAAAILQALPVPGNASTCSGDACILNNFVGTGSGPFKQDSFDTRIDYAATSTISVFGRFSLDYFKLSGTGVFGQMQGPGNGLLGLSGSSITHNYSLATGFTKTFSATLLTDFRFGYFKYNPKTQKPDGGTPMTGFGIPGANIDGDAKTNGLGAFLLGPDQISGQGCAPNQGGSGCFISSFGDGLGIGRCNCPLTESEQQFQFVNNWTKIRGNHQFKFGADIRYAMNLRIPSDNNRTGEYNFSPEATSNGGTGGLDLATFLLGDVTSFARYVNNPNIASANNAAERQKRWFFYGQDTFRLSSKLTLNYGLRWEIYFPETVNAKGNGGFANIVDNGGLGGIRVAGFGRFGLNGNVDNKLNAFAPRLGVAYQLTPKTVVRLGYGRSYDIGVFGSNFGHTVTQNLPVLLKQNYDASTFTTNAPNPNCTSVTPCSANLVPLFSLDAGPNANSNIDPASAFPPVPSDGFIPLTSNLSGTHIRPIRQTLPTVDAWNITVQRQLTNTMSLEVAYVGSKGTHGFAGNGPNYDINPAAVGEGADITHATDKVSGLPCAPGTIPNTGTCGPASFSYSTFTSQNSRRPLFPKIPFDLGNYYGNDASSTYNAFEVKLDKRFSNGLQFLTHYTFSHANNYTDSYYAIDHRNAWGPVDFARNHVWVLNTVYELPVGKGKKYMGDVSNAMEYLVGGWQLSNLTNWSSGLPWTPGLGECGDVSDTGPCRPNKVPGSFDVGVKGSIDPLAHNLTYFTPVSSLKIDPNSVPVGTDLCGVARPAAGPFALPACGILGNFGRNTFHGPAGFYSDLSIVKRFKIHERFTAQFRTDFFNLFNHPVYAFSANNGGNTCVDCGGGNNGKITNIEDGTSMRQIQFAIRFDF
ncbi:MAG TPA: TonB-dependent receptor [Terriglobales bacterium]|nr:TonB-dependent receptor [Terriglobales bacterium]